MDLFGGDGEQRRVGFTFAAGLGLIPHPASLAGCWMLVVAVLGRVGRRSFWSPEGHPLPHVVTRWPLHVLCPQQSSVGR